MRRRSAGRQARRAWVRATVREFQILAGQLIELTGETRHLALELALARVPPPNGPLETQLLKGWTLRYERECRLPVPAPATSLADRVCAHIETHLSARLTLQTIAAAIKERPRSIASSFRPAYGMTIQEYVTERRFRAVRPLLAGGMKVEAAARLAGLSRKALYRLVRARTGLTPRALGASPDAGSAPAVGRKFPGPAVSALPRVTSAASSCHSTHDSYRFDTQNG